MSVEIGLGYLYDLGELVADWNTDADVQLTADKATVFLPGASIRGFSVTAGEEAPFVRINSMASRADWQLAYSFIRFVADLGATPELPAEELTDEAAVARGTQELKSGAALLQHMLYERGNEYMGLPVLHFTLNVTRDDLPKENVDLDAFEALLIARAARYARARIPTVLTIQEGDGPLKTAVVWSGEALLTTKVDYVIRGEDEVWIDWASFLAAHATEHLRGQESLYYFVARD